MLVVACIRPALALLAVAGWPVSRSDLRPGLALLAVAAMLVVACRHALASLAVAAMLVVVVVDATHVDAQLVHSLPFQVPAAGVSRFQPSPSPSTPASASLVRELFLANLATLSWYLLTLSFWASSWWNNKNKISFLPFTCKINSQTMCFILLPVFTACGRHRMIQHPNLNSKV